MTCGIYMIQNKVNGKIYIGQAVDIADRWKRHKCELRGNYHINKHLQHAWNKDGEDNFEFTIICECNENQLNTMEEYYIFELIAYDGRVGYNKNYGGGSGRPTKEARKKISENNSRYWKGKTLSEEHKKKIRENNGSRRPEVRKKLSESLKGENAPWYGKHLSEEHRKKISESKKGKTPSEETRKKMSEARKGENHPMYGKLGVKNPNSIPVVQLTLDGKLVEVYGSAKEAERSGFNQSIINKCIRGKRNKHGGYRWCYLHDYIANIHPNIKTINLFEKTYNVNTTR